LELQLAGGKPKYLNETFPSVILRRINASWSLLLGPSAPGIHSPLSGLVSVSVSSWFPLQLSFYLIHSPSTYLSYLLPRALIIQYWSPFKRNHSHSNFGRDKLKLRLGPVTVCLIFNILLQSNFDRLVSCIYEFIIW
jgi:hypothetical protein